MSDPTRPLGTAGRQAWDDNATRVTDATQLLTYCETLDEREILRRTVLLDNGTPSDRRALRELEVRIEQLAAQVARDRGWFTYGGDRG